MYSASAANQRELTTRHIATTLAIVGGGLAGTCCAVTAARAGLKVTLVQDRPVLGGNSSSEVRLWVLGATSHMGNNNRWAREGGVIDEILVENMFRNREGNAVLFDTILLEKVAAETNITLLLNTAVYEAEKSAPDRIAAITAFCSQNSTRYRVTAPYFCDASGDGILGFLAGAAFRMGAESRAEFGEKFAPDAGYGELLGHTIYFYSKDTGRPVKYIPPAFALTEITKIPRWRNFTPKDFGSRLWWIEYGGRSDTVHETERIKWELWKVVYGVWHHIKNSGQFPEATNLTLEWVGAIPGKRESRRFEGDYILRQQDIVEQRTFPDAVSYGGWSIDLHPADGVYSALSPCNQWHARGVYQIPYRCLYSRNIDNLFLAGRIISASHVAFASTRVMATCAHGGQAVALAARHCLERSVAPRALNAPEFMRSLQIDLLRHGQWIPRVPRFDASDLAQAARVTASSEWTFTGFADDAPPLTLDFGWAQMLPFRAGRAPRCEVKVDVTARTTLVIELRTSNHPDNHTPDVVLGRREISLTAGTNQTVTLDFEVTIDQPRYVFLTLLSNPHVAVHTSNQRATGLLSVAKATNKAVSNHGEQIPPADIGVERFEFWCPQRRPGGRNLAVRVDPGLAAFGAANVVNGIARPTCAPNAWVADPVDAQPVIMLDWSAPQIIHRVVLTFDCDYDHPAESTLWGHPEEVMPFCVRTYELLDGGDRVIARADDHHHTRAVITFAEPIATGRLTLRLGPTHGGTPAALFEIACYSR
jgi:hypothetical protein